MPDGLERGGSSLLACCVDLQRLGGLTDALARSKNAAAVAKRRRHGVDQIELRRPIYVSCPLSRVGGANGGAEGISAGARSPLGRWPNICGLT